jgi:hypothetical protein
MHFTTLSFVCMEVYYNALMHVILHIFHYVMSHCFLVVNLVGTQISHMSPSEHDKLMLLIVDDTLPSFLIDSNVSLR